jgi:predicted AAA+ superfamily ATPase
MKPIFHDRYLEQALEGDRSRQKVRLVFGARQTGKTVLLRRLLQGPKCFIFNLQDSRLRQRFESDPSVFRQELMALGPGIEKVGVDEVQKVPALLEEIQFLYDQDPDRWQFFLTGSSARRLRRHSSNLLPGRSHLYHLYPVVRPEEDGFDGQLPAIKHAARDGFAARSLEARLMRGNLPGLHAEAPDAAAATLEAYVENYLEEEIRREAVVRNVGSFSSFLRVAALESGAQINLARYSQECGVAASTLRIYYQVLVDTFVGYWMQAYGRAGRKRVLTTPRFYLFDLGVRNAAARIPWAGTLSPDAAGRLFEHWVALELIHRAGYAGRSHGVFFWRTATGAEVDFVWQSPEEDIPIEVKWTSNPNAGDIRHLESFLRSYPARAHRGLLVCRIDRARQLAENVTAIPWQQL